MDDLEFRYLLDLMMCSDPWPAEPEGQGVLLDFVDKEASKRGYDGWLEAYHAFDPPGYAGIV
jgi:hypothetical protein